MSFTYRIYNQQGVYFVTFTVHQWIDVFTRNEYREIIIESLKYCQQNKGLLIFSWVLMSNHLHMIIGTKQNNLSDIIRDFKKYTSHQIYMCIQENKYESRKRWMLWLLKKDDQIIFWQEGYHAEEIFSEEFYLVKEKYIHMNPVRARVVEKEEEYLYSSCADRYGVRKGLIELAEY